jgi:N-acetylneuraminic acid mutarotase
MKMESRGFLLCLIVLFLIVSCSGGGGGGGGSNDDDPDPVPPAAGGTPLEVTLSQGDYWEFFWQSETVTFAQPNTTTSDTDVGRYRITLGSPVMISGLNAFPLIISGETTDGTLDMGPRWQYIAIDNDILWGSQDGQALHRIYDGSTGNWTGGGFFVEFADAETISPSAGTFDGSYNNLSAITISHETTSGGCETILGHTICSDTSTSFTEKEYMKEGIGPLAYTLAISYSSSGGGFYTSTQINRTIELIDTNYTALDGSQINQPPWRELSDMLTPRYDHAAVVLNNQIYVMGGFNAASTALSSMEIYDPVSDTWSTGTAMPSALSGHIAKVYHGKIYVIPCCANMPVYIYDPGSDSWTTGQNIPFDDSSLDGDIWEDSGLPFEGIAIASPNGALNGDMHIYGYDVTTDQWFSGVSAYTYDQRWFSVGVIADTMYIVGGYQQASTTTKVYNRARTYDLITDIWGTSTNPMNEARYNHCSVVLDDRLYVLGGRQSPGGPKLRSMEVYNPQNDTWTELDPMFHPRDDFAMAVLNGEIFAIGGNDGNGASAKMEAYTP